MTIRLYMAGPYSQRLVLKQRAEELVRESGGAIEITSSWLDGEHEAKEGNATLEEMAAWAYTDLSDIDRSNMLIQFVEQQSTMGGAHFEFAYALGEIQVIICGPLINPFHALHIARGDTDYWDSWPGLKAHLLIIAAGRSAA